MSWCSESVREGLPDGIDSMLDTLCLCDNVSGVQYRQDAGDWELRFEFCGHPMQCSLFDEGYGYGPDEAGRVFAFDDHYNVMFWIACELATRIDKMKKGGGSNA